MGCQRSLQVHLGPRTRPRLHEEREGRVKAVAQVRTPLRRQEMAATTKGSASEWAVVEEAQLQRGTATTVMTSHLLAMGFPFGSEAPIILSVVGFLVNGFHSRIERESD